MGDLEVNPFSRKFLKITEYIFSFYIRYYSLVITFQLNPTWVYCVGNINSIISCSIEMCSDKFPKYLFLLLLPRLCFITFYAILGSSRWKIIILDVCITSFHTLAFEIIQRYFFLSFYISYTVRRVKSCWVYIVFLWVEYFVRKINSKLLIENVNLHTFTRYHVLLWLY